MRSAMSARSAGRLLAVSGFGLSLAYLDSRPLAHAADASARCSPF